MRSRSFPPLYISGFVAVLLAASCRQGDVEWPAAGEGDLNDVVYVARLAEGGAEVVAVSAAGGVKELGLRCDGQSDVAVSPDGRRLYYGRDSALREYEFSGGEDRVVASFPAGVARETGTGEKGRGKTFAWRCGARFRDINFSPEGRVAFVVEPTECPVPMEEAAAGGKGELKSRNDFAFDAGAYLLEPGRDAPGLELPHLVYGENWARVLPPIATGLLGADENSLEFDAERKARFQEIRDKRTPEEVMMGHIFPLGLGGFRWG